MGEVPTGQPAFGAPLGFATAASAELFSSGANSANPTDMRCFAWDGGTFDYCSDSESGGASVDEVAMIYCVAAADCMTSGTIHVNVDPDPGNPFSSELGVYAQFYGGSYRGCPEVNCWSGDDWEHANSMSATLGDAIFPYDASASKVGSSCERTYYNAPTYTCQGEGGYGGYVQFA
jgi:hypothetical protein